MAAELNNWTSKQMMLLQAGIAAMDHKMRAHSGVLISFIVQRGHYEIVSFSNISVFQLCVRFSPSLIEMCTVIVEVESDMEKNIVT